MIELEYNSLRLEHLLRKYRLNKETLLDIVGEGLKNKPTMDEIFSSKIKLNYLKRIDKIFGKGIHYYLDDSEPLTTEGSSIFFRKASFEIEPNLAATQIVNQFEELKLRLSTMAKIAGFNFSRQLPLCTLADNPDDIGLQVREAVGIDFKVGLRDYLKSLINSLGNKNVFVFEFVETWNKKHKVNFDGFYITPNVIVLKRNQQFFRREIFTLAHELGHYMLGEEEIDNVSGYYTGFQSKGDQNSIEHWCNSFAFSFLAGKLNLESLNSIGNRNLEPEDLAKTVDRISRTSHLSELAIYTRLALHRQISWSSYREEKKRILSDIKAKQLKEAELKELEKKQGVKKDGRTPKPIKSDLVMNTVAAAFTQGLIDEKTALQTFNIKPDEITKLTR